MLLKDAVQGASPQQPRGTSAISSAISKSRSRLRSGTSRFRASVLRLEVSVGGGELGIDDTLCGQRWLDRLRPDALRWQDAIRLAVIDRLAPRPLEEFLPTGGIPPPEGRHQSLWPAEVWQLQRGMWLTKTATHLLDSPVHTLLVEARDGA